MGVFALARADGVMQQNELAAAQGITSPCSFDDLLGGWPQEDGEDKFEEAMAVWRKEEVRRGEF